MVGLAARVRHPSSSCLCSGFLFGELADDTNEGSVLVLQPLVVRLELCQNLQRDKDKVGLQLGAAGWTNPTAQREQQGCRIPSTQHTFNVDNFSVTSPGFLETGCQAWRGREGTRAQQRAREPLELGKPVVRSDAMAPAPGQDQAGRAGTDSELFHPKPVPSG